MHIFKEGQLVKIFYAFFLLLAFSAFAQNTPGVEASATPGAEAAAPRQELFFIAPLAEAAGYSYDSVAYVGGLTIGAGSGTAIGIKLLYFTDPENFVFMELLVFLRFYFFGTQASTGPFLQLIGGPVIYADNSLAPSGYGNFSAGLGAGWRIPLGSHFYIEPAIRAGYPYIVGGGISTGVRF